MRIRSRRQTIGYAVALALPLLAVVGPTTGIEAASYPPANRVGVYANPDGFIEVTRENADLHISEHFRLRDFERSGIPMHHMTVMSGFRTPEYNAHGGNTAGRAELSRHMYGDASDVFVDNNGDGRMDDLNHDGHVDYRDAQIIGSREHWGLTQ